MLKKLSVSGLNKRTDCSLTFHQDINIITGKNGSGKTTLLKLLWYMISGNLERIIPEISFSSAELETDRFRLAIKVLSPPSTTISSTNPKEVFIEWKLDSNNKTLTTTLPLGDTTAIDRLNSTIASLPHASYFFPTFRRIEGGFSMGGGQNRDLQPDVARYHYAQSESLRVEEAFSRLSDRISVYNHKFIASISTNDIVSMLTMQYADISERINQDNTSRSSSITELIGHYRRVKTGPANESSKLGAATEILEQIQVLITEHTERQEALLKPFSALNELITKIFQHKGIRLTSHLTLGETSQAIASDALSAGEKQMLSFLAYNAFSRNTVIFIDEPEISLHADWQRIIFPTLLSQGTQNQFIVATHSPFIYSKYADKELILDRDRGGE